MIYVPPGVRMSNAKRREMVFDSVQGVLQCLEEQDFFLPSRDVVERETWLAIMDDVAAVRYEIHLKEMGAGWV
eukprot:CAMPEP_0196810886 /NCGR_PEP_ID=MMETSP1362-20130617/15074_1 /TAXON_ID=163516 /ORGANISM="Leptocylindrus danicus, Strain CCMP1856" /LENGTH=72 /DNA_ID=CAMNT_0042186069 /DNA_START=333 /DNA_END=551 /DNA_ORIENTATION=-